MRISHMFVATLALLSACTTAQLNQGLEDSNTISAAFSVQAMVPSGSADASPAPTVANPEQRLRAELRKERASIVAARSPKVAFGVGFPMYFDTDSPGSIWVRQPDATLQSPMAVVGQELTLLPTERGAPDSGTLKVTARLAFKGGKDACFGLTGSGWAYAVEWVGPKMSMGRHFDFDTQIVPGRIKRVRREPPTKPALAKMAAMRFQLQNQAVAKYERENVEWLKESPESRTRMHQFIYGSDDNGSLMRRPNMEGVDVYTLRRPEGVFHVVPLSMGDDPEDRGGDTKYTLVFDSAGQVVRRIDGRVSWSAAVVDLDGDGFDEIVTVGSVLRIEKGAVVWPPNTRGGDEEVCET